MVDDKKIGTIKAPLSGNLRFQLVANTDKAGMRIDLTMTASKYTAGLVNPVNPKISRKQELPGSTCIYAAMFDLALHGA